MSTKAPFLRATVAEQKPIHANLLIAAAVNSGEEYRLRCLPGIKYPRGAWRTCKCLRDLLVSSHPSIYLNEENITAATIDHSVYSLEAFTSMFQAKNF